MFFLETIKIHDLVVDFTMFNKFTIIKTDNHDNMN